MCVCPDDVSISGYKDAAPQQSAAVESASEAIGPEQDGGVSPDTVSATSQSIDEPTKDMVTHTHGPDRVIHTRSSFQVPFRRNFSVYKYDDDDDGSSDDDELVLMMAYVNDEDGDDDGVYSANDDDGG